MAEGIRATVEFPGTGRCPISTIADETGAAVDRVWRNLRPDGDAPAVSEFLLEAEEAPDGVTEVLVLGDRRVLRLVHDDGADCPCARLGRHGCAVNRYVASPERLRLVFDAEDYAELQTVVADLRERFPDVDVTRLVRAPADAGGRDEVVVQRGRLTDRQLEVLGTAYRMGYFERPRGANATEVAAALDVTASTVAEHLAAAQSKLLEDVLGDGS